MIKYNANTINDLNFDDANVIKIYRNNAVCYYKLTTSGGSRLPQGYTEVEYVQHSNDVHSTSNVFWTVPNDGVSGNVYTVDLSLDSSQSGNSRYIQLFGSTYGYCYRQDSGYRYNANVGYMTKINYSNSYTPPYDTKLRYRLEPLKLTVTNTVASTSDTINLSSSRSIGSGGTDFGVFNANMNDSGAYCLKGKIYSILIEDSNGVIKHNYVPCKRDSDNVIGLYDIIGNGFYNPSVLIVTAGDPIDYSVRYLTLVAETDGVSYKYDTYTSSNILQYSTDSGTTWNELANGSSTSSVNTGDKVMFKASGLTVNTERGIGRITPSASASVEGNIMSLEYGDDFSGQIVIPNNYQFRKLFSGVTTITSAENMVLPATTVKQQCYSQMFQGCSNLVTAPKVIGSSSMTWSGDYCCSDMFNSCTSLVNAPQLPALNLGTQCYWYMFQNCTSLTTAPELLATTTATQCYNGMFSGCISLNYIKVMSSNGFNMSDWVKDVASSGTFVKSSTATFSSCGQNTYPCNWTVQNA